MQLEEEINSKENDEETHNLTPQDEESKNEKVKKVRLFSAKEFRKQINRGNSLAALKDFLTAVNESKKHDYIFEYLENGGNCLELLQTLELDSTIPPVLVFDLVTHVLLKISAKYPQYQSPAYEACRYILNNYITVINKMINLSSTSQERKSCLKLLTAMVTFSANLAKEILLQVNFHSTNIELLTKSTGEKDSVRDYFIHFLTAFLVDGNYPTLSTLLEKKGFIKSIIAGLQYDSADTVCVVISGMKNHILENPLVSKTAKMKVFNTSVVRDIVNLYNWKGPAAVRAQKKNKTTSIHVDEYAKSKVSECVHEFLLVLCTSHRYGVIFRDHLMGLGKKNQNALMYTVLESLERPWEHSYACDLVTKICGACPDLAKTMWSNLKPFLEPRLTQKWLNAMKFAKTLLNELQPSCVEFCVRELSVYQLAQVVQFLVAPIPILRVIIPENCTFERPSVKKHVMLLLSEMLKALEYYLEASKAWLSPESNKKLKNHICNHITRNFPNAKMVLDDWEQNDETDVDEISVITQPRFLEIIFDIFYSYKQLAPQLLDSLHTISAELTEFLGKVGEICHKDSDLRKLQTKIIGIFIDVDQSKFTPKTDTFSTIVPLLLHFYYDTADSNALLCLRKLFKNTGIFDGCFHEINIWINGILDLKNFDESVANILTESLKLTYAQPLEYIKELSKLKSEKNTMDDISELMESLLNDVVTENRIIIKHKYLSPMIVGYLSYLNDTEVTKSLKVYLSFVLLNLLHCQTDYDMLKGFILNHDTLPKNIKSYFLSWVDGKEIAVIKKTKGKFELFHSFSEEFLTGNIDSFLAGSNLSLYEDLPLNLLQTGIFYISNLVQNSTITETNVENCEKFIKYLLDNSLFRDNYTETILGHPVLLNNISFLSLNKDKPQSFCTKFLLNTIKYLLNSGFNIEDYLKLYRDRLLTTILKILKKPQKYELSNFTEVLQLFGLSYEQSFKVLSVLTEMIRDLDDHLTIIFDILRYSLENLSHLCQSNSDLKPLSNEMMQILTKYFVKLSQRQEINIDKLTAAFHEYFKVFPHNIKDIHSDLFTSLLNRDEFSKENVNFAVFLVDKNIQFFDIMKNDLDKICHKKGVILPIIDVLVNRNYDEAILKQIFENFESPLTKALQKPQKAGQHFHQNHKGLAVLIERYMALEKCESFFEKAQKFEVAEIFHAKLLEALSNKIITTNVSSKRIYNIILTFVHLQMFLFKRKTKPEDDLSKLRDIASCFNNILAKIQQTVPNQDLKDVSQNETLKLYVKFCLKFGVSGEPILLKSVTNLVNILSKSMEKEDGKLILDMLASHSEFLDNMLGEHSEVKLEILSLFLVLCKNWGEFMERGHVPLLLASYRAMVNRCDRIILALLEMYETKAGQTNFYDFKPYLWGKAAASHYSVRMNIENALWRQPKMGDVLDILQEEYVYLTITNYPLRENLQLNDEEILETAEERSYDLKFLLPLFSQLLAHEQQVQTYKFTRSGALSLTVVGLSSKDKEVRQAAAHVLSRFHFHMDARQNGKDNLLWIRYIEAVGKGTAMLPDFKLNNFSAIYLARMALILTQPNHVMYVPLSQHLTAKALLDFSTVPELYTLLHSSDVNYKEHRNFILELLRDGLRTEKDFTDFMRSMAFKLFSELYSCSISDWETKSLILDVVNAACKIPLGVKMLCENHSLLAQIFTDVYNNLVCFKEKQELPVFVEKIVKILLEVMRVLPDRHSNFMVFNIVMNVVNDGVFNSLSKDKKRNIFEILNFVFTRFEDLLSEDVISVLLGKSGDKFCKYMSDYGCQFVNIDQLDVNGEYYYLRLLIFNKLKK